MGTTNRDVAIAIVDDIMGDKVDRLVLEKDGVHLGGWARRPLIDRIENQIKKHAKKIVMEAMISMIADSEDTESGN